MPADKDKHEDEIPVTELDNARMAAAIAEATRDDTKMKVPKGHEPEEFYTDAQLAVYYQQQHDALSDKHPDKNEAKRRLRAAKMAAFITGTVDPDIQP